MIYAGDPGSNRALGKQSQLSRRDYPIDVSATPTLPDADLRYQEALDWRKWLKEDAATSCVRGAGPRDAPMTFN